MRGSKVMLQLLPWTRQRIIICFSFSYCR